MTDTRILLITHAPLASALRQCALHVFPDCAASDLLALDVAANEAPEAVLAAARCVLGQGPDANRPTLVLTDVFGATPCTVAQQLVAEFHAARLVTGVNLPMLWRSLCYRREKPDALVRLALEGAVQGIFQVNP